MKKIAKHPGLYRLPDGRFRLRATAKDPRNGKMRHVRKTLPHGATIEEAVTALHAAKAKIREGAHTEPQPNAKKDSVTDYGVRWLEDKSARVRPHVADRYEQAMRTHILEHIGDFYVDAFTREDVRQWQRTIQAKRMANGEPYARATIMGFWVILRAFLRDMAAEYGVPDPTYRVDPPNPEALTRRELRTLTPAQLADLLGAVKQYTPDRHAEVATLAYTGIRAGENYAAMWSDIDESRSVITISRSVWRGHVSGTKTDAPREVALTQELLEILRDHRRWMVRTQHEGLSTGLIFPADNGSFRMSGSLHKPLDLAAEAAGIPVKVTPQVLRRTFNTLMVEHIEPDRIVLRSQMGHSSEKLTERYSGVSAESKLEAVNALQRLVQGVK